jgi:hypothetical protein
MKKLLAIMGIKSVYYVDIDGITYTFYFTDKLLAHKLQIEFYEYEREEVEYDENEEDNHKYETCLTAVLAHKNDFYEFTILFDVRPHVPPMYLYRIILDLVEIVENSDSLSLIENLESAAGGASESTKSYRGDEKLRKGFNDHVSKKINRVLELIEDSKNEVN